MGNSSRDRLNSRNVEPTVGGLVWVRRKNGSWWPGQILDANDFPDDSLPSPRSEVPIQLLARDDTSVEWHNLEKSNGVKAFRCGDYDTCIEKAKVLVSNSSKKTAKHTKRENAILCALKLESELLSKIQENNCSRSDSSGSESGGQCSNKAYQASDYAPRYLDLVPEKLTSIKEKCISAPKFSHSVTPSEEENKCNDLERPSVCKTQRDPHDSEDEGSEGVKRMRGLNDLGNGSDKALSGGLAESGPQDGLILKNLCGSNNTVNKVQANGVKGDPLPLSFKKKRSKVVFHEYLKRKNRRRMLTKVLKCNKWVTIPVMYDDFPNPCKSRASQGIGSNKSNLGNGSNTSCEYGTSKCINGHTSNGSMHGKLEYGESLIADFDADNLVDVPVIGKEEFNGALPYLVPSVSSKPQMELLGECPSQNGHVETSNGPGCASFATTHGAQFSLKMDKGASSSEWQSKGRRNSRHLAKNGELDSKRIMDNIKIEVVDHFEEPSSSYIGQVPNHSPLSDEHLPSNGHAYGGSRSLPFHQSGIPIVSRYEVPDASSSRSLYTGSVMYDVEIGVKASYRPHHVPYISLMSKLNGKAIIGHPIPVEVLEDGGCDCYLDSMDLVHQTSESLQADEDMVCWDEEEVDVLDEEVEYLEGRGDHTSPKKRVKAWHVSSPSSSPKPQSSKSPLAKSKKLNGTSGKKTRRLSALTGSFRGKKGGSKNKKKNHNHPYQDDGWKPIQNAKSSAITCIPLKLVFSRINEALSGPAITNNGAIHSS